MSIALPNDRAICWKGHYYHVITVEDLTENVVTSLASFSDESGEPRHLKEVERRHVQAVLHEEKGNKVHVARVLGISGRSLYRCKEPPSDCLPNRPS